MSHPVTSLCDLGATQTERLQTLFRVTNQGWWVVAANDVQMQHRITSYDLELREDPTGMAWRLRVEGRLRASVRRSADQRNSKLWNRRVVG